MMKMDGFQHYRNIHVVDLIAFGVLLVLVLDDCVLGFFGSGRDILASHFVDQRPSLGSGRYKVLWISLYFS
jgi:hypothetical protein